MNNVIQMTNNISTLDQLGDDLRALDTRKAANKIEFVEIAMGYCITLTQARKQFTADIPFGNWCDANCKLNKNDRTAMVGFGRDLKLARTVFEETTRLSYQLIWADKKRCFPEGRSTSASRPASKSNNPKNNTPDHLRQRAWNSTHPFFELERGKEIASVFIHRDGPRAVANALERSGYAKIIWDMILQCYDAGFLTETIYRPLTDANYPTCSLRVLFPEAPRGYASKFNLLDVKQREHVRDVIIPAALAASGKLRADPSKLEQIVKVHVNGEAVPVKAAAASIKPAAVKVRPAPVKVEPTPAPVKSVSKPVYENIGKPKYLSQQEVDPEFEGTPVEFTKLYGHVQIYNAEQFASLRFSYITDGFRELAKRWQQLDIDKRPIVHKWLRSPDSRDVARLAEALELLRPQFAEAEKVLAIAQATLKK